MPRWAARFLAANFRTAAGALLLLHFLSAGLPPDEGTEPLAGGAGPAAWGPLAHEAFGYTLTASTDPVADGARVVGPTPLSITPLALVNVTIETAPPNLTIVVDGVRLESPQTFAWENGSDHLVGTDAFMTSGGRREVFSNWSDGGQIEHTFHVDGPALLLATFSTEYRSNVTTVPAGLRLTVDLTYYLSPVEFWWAEGSVHDVRPDEIQATPEGVRYTMAGWGDGGPPRRTVVADGPKDLVASFVATDYLLTLEAPSFASAACSYPECWYGVGDTATFWFTPPPENGSSTRARYQGWTVSPGNGSPNTSTSGSILMDGPKRVDSLWLMEHLLTVTGLRGELMISEWYTDGESAAVSLNATEVYEGEVRWVFTRWSGALNTTSPTFEVMMDSPKQVTSLWREQFALYLELGPGSALGGGWYDPGSVAVVSLNETFVESPGSQWSFEGWAGAVNSTSARLELRVDAPIEIRALWSARHYLTVVSEHGQPLGGGWYDEGEVAAVSISSLEVEAGGERLRFAGWDGAGGGSAPAVTVLMDGPRTVTARWERAPPPFAIDPLAALAVAGSLIAGTIVVLSTPRGEYVAASLSVPLFTRLRRDEVRNQFTRGRILQYIEDHPGANYAHIRRRLGLSNGACAYHLRVLERHGDIRRLVSGVSVRFYGTDYKFDAEALPPLAYVQRRILEELVAAGSATFGELSQALEARGEAVTDTNLGYHLNVLAREKELIDTRREGRKTIYFLDGDRREFIRQRLIAEYGVDEAMDAAALSRSASPVVGQASRGPLSQDDVAFGQAPDVAPHSRSRGDREGQAR